MSSSGNDGVADDSVICLDSSIDENAIEIVNDCDQSVLENVAFDKTLPPGVAPDGFIIVDETQESDKVNELELTRHDDKKKEEAEKPMFKIVFGDESISRLYKKRVKDFFHRLVSGDIQIDESYLDKSHLVLEVRSKKTSRKRSHDHLEVNEVEKSNNHGEESFDMLFRIENRPTIQDRLDVPTYGKKFDQIMKLTSEADKAGEEESKSACRPKMNCFNCMGNHSIRDCPVPRNYNEIQKNRNEFTSRTVQKVGRYHVENDDQRHERFVPGQISRELKRALGIGDNQLPHYIYRMRKLGYPPGWLKEARLQHSGMNLYNSDGVLEMEDTDEAGEIFENGDKDQYDLEKIKDFPGFNVRPPSGTREDDKKYWKSNRYTSNSKESLLAMISEKKVEGYKRKKLKRTIEPSTDNIEQTPTEMDVEKDVDDNVVENVSVNGFFIPPLPKSPAKPPLPLDSEDGAIDSPKGELPINEAVASPGTVDSPSLADLERRKKQLLAELDDSSQPSPPSTPVTSRSCSSTSHSSCVDQQEPQKASITNDPPQTVEAMCSLTTPSRGSVKSVDLGTPLLESTSPYSKLPSVENFAKDVCDIINFENLPDSTGKYEKMSGILQKVRNTLAMNQQE
ncbi:zinc finger CCHC domain-containing protein 8 homolog [Venturia canescens]|uniref:zinc finger CCHC domain-containing protein 8 homolog n=1 Tax=Venturia canescens TaxID=32260 RepID=UPI001C9CAF6A|nr:zinc finger CCHC domain-containing protein 8 homolog [Venturia canescens]